jgi:hypothetical protein
MKYRHLVTIGRDRVRAWCAENGYPGIAAEIEARVAKNPKAAPITHLQNITLPPACRHDLARFVCERWQDRPACADFLAQTPEEQRRRLGRASKAQGILHSLKINGGFVDTKGAGFGWMQDDEP